MSSSALKTTESIQDAIKESAEAGQKRKTFYSFGDEGVTATVGADGRLLRISRYFPGEKTGFCVDDPEMPEPWLFDLRFEKLLNLAESPGLGGGIGPTIDGSSIQTIVNDRWPTFEGTWNSKGQDHSRNNSQASDDDDGQDYSQDDYRYEDQDDNQNDNHDDSQHGNEDVIPFKLQYIVSKGTIYQRLVFSRRQVKLEDNIQVDAFLAPELQIKSKLLLRDLDYVTAGNIFNKAESDENRYLPVDASTMHSSPNWGEASATMNGKLLRCYEHSLTNGLNATLDFFLRRNLEYILSVCSIPISGPTSGDAACFALICGDVDSHRVATPASLYSFQLLILALRHFESLRKTNGDEDSKQPKRMLYIRRMRDRIYRVCLGHIRWLFVRVKSAIKEWIEELDQMNQSRHYAFPRKKEGLSNTFYLADHALTWRAIKSAEAAGLSPECGEWKPATSYSSDILRRHVLSRFTTKNPQSEKRMIAVTRSPLYTRFILRSRDSALFPAMDLGLFGEAEQISDVWRNTIDCQKNHEDNDDLNWCDPRKFALSLILAFKQTSINGRSVSDMYQHAISVLLRGSSANGLPPGLLSEKSMPVAYLSETSRDNYWEITFEVPRILWTYCLNPKDLINSANEASTTRDSDLKLVLDDLKSLSHTSAELGVQTRSILTGPRSNRPYRNSPMKHIQPFNSIVNEENIVELQDEWLYNEPSFFVGSSNGTGSRDAFKLRKASARDYPQHDTEKGLLLGFMIDVPKSRPSHEVKSNSRKSDEFFHEFFKKAPGHTAYGERTHRQKLEEEVLGICFSYPARARGLSEQLFRRGKKSHFTEETVAALNTWTTELRLSFYRLGKRKALTKVAMSFHFEGDFFDRYWTCRFLDSGQETMWEAKSTSQDPAKDAMLRHHEGISEVYHFTDLPGKFWEDIRRPLTNSHGDNVTEGSWQQRRVLELLLFGAMLKDRQAERPRWTFHDENRFLAITQKLQVYNEHEMLKLNRSHLKISKLEESLIKKLEMIRSDLEDQLGRETQLFTYVTVLFLPLGFATGIFSMSEAPTSQTLRSMIFLACMAFIVIAALGLLLRTLASTPFIRWGSQWWSKKAVLSRSNLKTWQLAIADLNIGMAGLRGVTVATWGSATSNLSDKAWTMALEGWNVKTRKWKIKIRGKKKPQDFDAEGDGPV
ncbi:hypothetical protein Landi51_12868 [Colletotrichum acutatum]